MSNAMRDDALHAYVDGALTPEQRELLEATLRSEADAAARVRAYQAQNEAMRQAFESVLAEPHDLRVPGRPANDPLWWKRIGAMAGALVAGVAIGFVARGYWVGASQYRTTLVQQVVLAHAAYSPEVRHPVEVAAQEEQHLVAWLSKRLASPLKAPRLDETGYRLLGGRLLPAAGESGDAPVALLMYENGKGKRLSLLVRREAPNRETAFRFAQEGETRVFYWIDGPFGYALAGEIDRDELARLSRAVYQQLNP